MEQCDNNSIEYKHQYKIPNASLRHDYDFYLYAFNLLVEIDGDYWHLTEKAKVKDDIYDNVAISCGYNIIRFLGSNIKKSEGKCFDEIFRKYDG